MANMNFTATFDMDDDEEEDNKGAIEEYVELSIHPSGL
jgi:hypothetical protein